MTENLKRVPGGWSLFIPDAVAKEIGLAGTDDLQVRIMGHDLVVRCPEFRRKKIAEMHANLTPEMFHDPDEPYDGVEPELTHDRVHP